MSPKLLIVDDEPSIVHLLKDHFEFHGYEVYTAFDGLEAIQQAQQHPECILLDINMPELDGLEVCNRIRDVVSCPILFVTAKIEDSDKVKGLQVGGDDYIVKPFSLPELTARVEAHIRRDQRHLQKKRVYLSTELMIDYEAKELYVANTEINLTKKEFDIVELLSTYQGQVFDKERIYEVLWGLESDGDSAVVTEHIRKIRLKFLKLDTQPPIETIWGVGYKWKI
ncbi:DNA-binding response regulator [Siminovitchia terrae]|uniref:DNA-binding response regulator n=1 Tax=Siminovitchia terrae TaxID=1914933 RepID=A0A429X182_SIMTE|nr:response regulator transcription factor [Siminovitchia terrae]RST57216.1 response regulator transcription factor [Siminovitchia terrae]GIN90213.1 DNA-binding response regulator [Siminovitchia terrae]GIN94278.1 DNA-binding response regulator [Siminovitchia terrae]